MVIGELCNRTVVVMDARESPADAARLMRDRHVGDVVLVESREGRRFPVGIITDRDIVVEFVAPGVDLETVEVRDAMTGDLFVLQAADEPLDAIHAMRNRGVRRAPVVSPDGALMGIITVDDLIEILAEQMNNLVGLMSRERSREHQARP